jgi:hypothetical protein
MTHLALPSAGRFGVGTGEGIVPSWGGVGGRELGSGGAGDCAAILRGPRSRARCLADLTIAVIREKALFAASGAHGVKASTKSRTSW